MITRFDRQNLLGEVLLAKASEIRGIRLQPHNTETG